MVGVTSLGRDGKAAPPERAASKETTGDESMSRPQQQERGLENLMDLPLESEDDGETRPEGALDEAGSLTAIFANDQPAQLADSARAPRGTAFVTADETARPTEASNDPPPTATKTAAVGENSTLMTDGVVPMNVDREEHELPSVEKLLGKNWQNGFEAFMEGPSAAPSASLNLLSSSGNGDRAIAASTSSGIPAQQPPTNSPSLASKGQTATQMHYTNGNPSANEARVVSTTTITNKDSEEADATNVGGVFDDAEDDVEIVVPASAPDDQKEQAGSSATTHSSGLKTSRLQEIRDNVLRHQPRESTSSSTTSATKSPVQKAPKSSATPAAKPSAKLPVEKAAKKKLEKKRRGPNKPMKRFLFAKKESDQATQLLQGKGDLADCLSAADCQMLGEHFWIFTVEQLATALKAENNSTGSEGRILDRITAALVRRYQIDLSEENESVQASGLLEDVKDSEPKADAPIETLSQKEDCDLSDSLAQSASASREVEVFDSVPKAPEPTPSVGGAGPESADSTSNGNGKRFDNPLFHQKANQTIGSWHISIEKFQRDATKEDGTESLVNKQFDLENAIKYLFPPATLNFLKSIKVETLWSFLSLKKTETGAVCELIEMWRKECGLQPVPHLGVARHLAGVAARVESALSVVPCVTDEEREWMKDPIIGLTGAAREFLVVDQGFVSASEFASRPTKEVADELEKWREKKGMEPLKGTGKIANISTWKAQAKEAVESEAGAGRVVKALANTISGNTLNVDRPDPVAPADVSSLPPPKKRKKKSTPAPPASDRSVQYALHSNLFLEDSLGEEVADIIAKAGIKTAAELFDADTKRDSTLHRALLNAGKASSEVTFKRVIDIWRGKLRKDLDQLGQKAVAETAHQPEETVSETSSKRPRSNLDGVSEPIGKKIVDPLDALSRTTLIFLNSIGVTTAAELLTTRTTDISSDFVKWRVAEGKPELRGQGAIASVSGWKSAVRSRAKELGMDQTSELEPKHKAVLNSQASSPKRSKRSKQESGAKKTDGTKMDFINQMRRAPRAADCTLPPGKGLHEDGRKLFAVQHRELPGHFVFLLSLRNRGGGVTSTSEIYATHRGFGPRSGITEKASKVSLELANGKPDDVENEVPNFTLVDVSVNRNAASPSSKIDLRIPFSASRPGCGLIEIGKHGGYPYNKQDLSPLQTAIVSFVLNDCSETPATDGDIGLPDEQCNVLIEKVGHDKFNFLLYLHRPIEQGQAVAVVFPSLSSTLRSTKYDDSEFRTRHIIDEATRTLSIDDLRSLLSWLHDVVLQSTGYSEVLKEEAKGNDFDFKVACARRRRLCWVSRRILAAIGGSRVSPEDTKLCFILEFGRKTREKNDDWSMFSQNRKADFVAVIRSQLLLELRSTLELDITCGTGQRIGWCPRSLKLFNDVVECALQSYFYTPENNASTPDCRSALFSSLAAVLITNISSTDFTNADMLGDFVVHQNSSCSSDGRVRVPGIINKEAEQGYLIAIKKWNETAQDLREAVPDNLGSVACIGEKRENEPFSIVMRNPGDIRSGHAYLSSDWYRCHFWRIVATVLSAFRGNLAEYSEVSAYEFDKVLSLAGPLVISREAFRSKPVEVSYKQRLRLPQIDDKNDYALPSEPLFLGLVWPVLRDSGWQLEAGGTPSEVYFHPKAHARKQMFDLKRRRNYDRMLLKREISKAGLGQLTKRSKRLLVAVAANGTAKDNVDQNDTTESSTQIDPYGATYSVAGILQSFSTFLAKRVSEKGGSDQSAKITAIVDLIGKCFDSLARNFPPIQGLKGAVEVGEGQRPIYIYSGEYLLQFLFLLPDALQQEDLSKDSMSVLAIAQDLLRFISAKRQELLAKPSHLPREHYVLGDDDLSSPKMFLESKLTAVVPDRAVADQKGKNQGHVAGSTGAPTNWLPDRDQAGVTDFIFTAYQQTMPCRATAEDTIRKGRRGVTVGFPGLCCRHCMGLGEQGEGRYFFSSLESLASSYNGFEKHFLRCSMVPAEIKQKISFARSQHAQQRTGLKFGSQQSFFSRMWEWLHSSKSTFPDVSISGDASQQYGTPLSVLATDASNKEAFSDHIAVLDHLRSSKVSAEVEEALDRYYSALDYAGRVYNTSAMPEHFTVEWLLAKMTPKNVHHAMRNVG